MDLHDPARKSAQIESTAEAVLEGKQLLVDLDKRQNATREAINALKQKRAATFSTSNVTAGSSERDRLPSLYSKPRLDNVVSTSAAPNSFVSLKKPAALIASSAPVFLLCNGGTFVLHDCKSAVEKLQEDQKSTAKSIEEAREALKQTVAELARLEGPDSALSKLHAGFDLKAVNKK